MAGSRLSAFTLFISAISQAMASVHLWLVDRCVSSGWSGAVPLSRQVAPRASIVGEERMWWDRAQASVALSEPLALNRFLNTGGPH